MPSTEQTFFLSVLADHLNGRPTQQVSGLDWENVYDTAEKHQLSALVYAQCGAFMPPEAELRFLQDFGAAVTNYAARQKIASELDRAFTRQNLPYVIVKGLAVAESYPQPELRTMGDVDVIVKAEDKERAHELLLELGFLNACKGCCEWVYWKDSCELELHHRLLYADSSNDLPSLMLANQMWDHVQPVPGSTRRELDGAFHFLFLLMHLKKHLAHNGAGFRQFMDLAVAAQKRPLECSRLNAWLEDADLRAFAEVCLTLCRTWFQLPLPLAEAELSPEFEEESRQQIFSSGVFGSDNQAKRCSILLFAKINAGGGRGFRQRLRLCWNVLMRLPGGLSGKARGFFFPNYESLRKTERYGFINRRPWLLPMAWCYRFIRGLRYGVTQFGQILLPHRSVILKRNETLRKMGLSMPPEDR